MNTPPPVSGVGSSPAFHLASLLDLNTRLSEADPVDIFNVAILSVMGRLKIQRACFLLPDADGWTADPRFCKGIRPFSIKEFATHGIERVNAENPDHIVLANSRLNTIVPIEVADTQIAVMLLGNRAVDHTDEGEVNTYLEIVRSIVGTTMHNAKLVQSLMHATKELQAKNLMVTTLFESARDFTGSKTKEELLRILSYHLMGQLMVSRFGIFLTEPLDGVLFIGNNPEARKLADIHDSIININKPIRIEDISPTDLLRMAADRMGIALAVPMMVHGVKKGVIATKGKLNGLRFTDEELSFLESLGNTAMIAIENERLLQEEMIKRRLENELEIAAEIQHKLLPEQLPSVKHLDVAANARTSRQIGGDYYDVIILDNHRTLFAIADVAGKGIPAALLMANVQAALNVLARIDMSLTALMTRLNSLICENTEADVFVTIFICVIDSDTLSIEYVNAGHNPPILLHGADMKFLTTGGVLTGVIEEPPDYLLGADKLTTGDVLLLYTDGVTEARRGLAEYGVDSLVDSLRERQQKTALEIIHTLESDVRAFTGTDHLEDDSSMVAIKVI